MSASTRRIAERADFNHRLVGHHFGSKELLWQATAKDVFGHSVHQQRERYQGSDGVDQLKARRAKLKASPVTLLFNSRSKPWTPDGVSTSFYRIRDRVFAGTADGPSIHDLRKTAATHMVILQKSHPELITDQVLTDQVLTDMFGWTPGTLAKMKRIYVSDAAVITAMTGRK
ncbi:MAG: hypothetical protein V7741_02025 [Hyphomonas sp.]